jgi:hypothetical protein
VAYHTALQAKASSAARKRRERRADDRTAADPLEEITGRELLAVLDEELRRLPDHWREPLVLCYLEGLTRDEAARRLGWSLGTLKRRLEQARECLRLRLERRGLAMPSALVGLGVMTAAVPADLTAATVRAATLSLLRGVPLGKFKAVAVLLMALGLAAAGAGVFARRTPAVDKPEVEPKAPAAQEKQERTVAGRVLDAEGKPVAEAEVALVAHGWDFAAKDYEVLKKGVADKDGRFRLSGPWHASGESLLLVGKTGYGFHLLALSPEARQQETTLTLPPEQPLRGRLLDLQGQPVAGVKVGVMRIGTRDDVSLFAPSEKLPLWPSPAVSDADGRFAILRLPPNKETMLVVQEDRFARQHLQVSADNRAKEITWSLSPARLLEGKVVYEDTGKPAANARLASVPTDTHAGTDAGGRFKLSLSALAQRNLPPLQVHAAEGEPYLAVRQEVVWPRAAIKHEIEVKLPRGVLVRGKVTEAGSGRPVAGAGVQYVPRDDNPNLRPNVLTGWQNVVASGSDGSFQIAVPAGPGHLLVSGPGLDFIHEDIGSRVLTVGKPGGYRVNADAVVKLDLAANAGPQEVKVALRRGVTVRGRLLDPEGKPVARAEMVCGLLRSAVPSNSNVEVRDGLFALHGCDPDKEYPVLFLDPEKGWGAAVTLAGKQAGGESVTVRLTPCGRAVARFVDAEGKPLKDQPIWKAHMLRIVVTPAAGPLEAVEDFAENLISRKERVARKGLKTDAEGRVTYSGLIPGATYRITVLDPKAGEVVKKEVRAESDKTLELGDVSLPRR